MKTTMILATLLASMDSFSGAYVFERKTDWPSVAVIEQYLWEKNGQSIVICRKNNGLECAGTSVPGDFNQVDNHAKNLSDIMITNYVLKTNGTLNMISYRPIFLVNVEE